MKGSGIFMENFIQDIIERIIARFILDKIKELFLSQKNDSKN